MIINRHLNFEQVKYKNAKLIKILLIQNSDFFLLKNELKLNDRGACILLNAITYVIRFHIDWQIHLIQTILAKCEVVRDARIKWRPVLRREGEMAPVDPTSGGKGKPVHGRPGSNTIKLFLSLGLMSPILIH